MIVAAIPVKRLDEAKSRLAVRLSPQEREVLVRRLLRRTLDVVRQSGVVEAVALVTPEPDLASDMAAPHVPDRGDLNEGLASAVQWALGRDARSLLILPADLPFLMAEEIRAFVLDDPPRYGIAIAPTEDGGTGALLLTPPNIIPPAFGTGSYERHLVLAQLAGVRAERVESRGFLFDLDTPADLDRYLTEQPGQGEGIAID